MDLLIVLTFYSIDANSTMNKGGSLGCMLMMEGGGTCRSRFWRSHAACWQGSTGVIRNDYREYGLLEQIVLQSCCNWHHGRHHLCSLRHALECLAHVTSARLSATHT